MTIERLDRVFLDANILYSAAYGSDAGLKRLWNLKKAVLLTSDYAIAEARRNLAQDRPPALDRLEHLVADLVTTSPMQNVRLPSDIRLDEKDRPILLAAIDCKADYLLTGDARHFGHLYGRRVASVLILRPAQYLNRVAER